MPRRYKQNYDFQIHVDPSCLSEPMDEETLSQSGGIEKQDETLETQGGTSVQPKVEEDPEENVDEGEENSEIRSSIETEQAADQHDLRPASAASRRSSKRTEEIIHELDYTETKSHSSSRAARTTEDDSSSQHSQHEATDEDVFSDKSPRSSLGSYDFGYESGKGHEFPDNLTSVSRSPRRSDISHYRDDDDQDFVPTIRGTPRPPFRTPSDVRAMQMSSPTQSVVGGGGTSPRSNRRYVPTASRLGTPTGSAQFSPKKTPDRLKPRKEAPLVLLHVTLLPLRWAWGELVGSLEAADLSRDAKGLRDAWRLLQDRLGDTTCERGILLGHPQNDYEVLEERLLEALELPVRRRARILECGHYLGPANEMADDDDSDPEYDDDDHDDDMRSHHSSSRRGSRADNKSKQHWCGTCQSDIRYESLGPRTKVFRVKVYASNGLMKAGAWAACWKEMERVDVEIEPIVEPAVQDELVRLAANQQERDREEDEIAHEVAQQFAAEKKAAAAGKKHDDVDGEEEEEERGRSRGSRPRSAMHARVEDADDDDDDFIPPAQEDTEPNARTSRSAERRRHVGEERYGTERQQPHDAGSYAYDGHHQDHKRQKLEGASLPELVLESARVLIQDRKNLAIIALSVFVLLLAVRTARHEPPYELGDFSLHGIVANVPEMRHVPIVEAPPTSPASMHHEDILGAEMPLAVAPEFESEAPEMRDVPETQEQGGSEFEQQAPKIQECPPDDDDLPTPLIQESAEDAVPEEQVPTVECVRGAPVEQASMEDTEGSAVEADEMSAIESAVSGDIPEIAAAETDGASEDEYDACVRRQEQAALAASGPEDTEAEAGFEIVTQKRTVRVIQTVTQTETQVEYVKVTATEFLPQAAPTSSFKRGPEVLFCDTVCWEPAMPRGLEGRGWGEPVVEDAVEHEEAEVHDDDVDDGDDENSRIDEANSVPCPVIEEAA
ncbi:hypothetical protein SLS62_001670 [Diatrype stigma]|uniref:Pathway-specific nitrogen regulator n=1 Tax=Diatrype stigma TaxID=117547 RepID=A0AAN9UVQ1_9PEZI